MFNSMFNDFMGRIQLPNIQQQPMGMSNPTPMVTNQPKPSMIPQKPQIHPQDPQQMALGGSLMPSQPFTNQYRGIPQQMMTNGLQSFGFQGMLPQPQIHPQQPMLNNPWVQHNPFSINQMTGFQPQWDMR